MKTSSFKLETISEQYYIKKLDYKVRAIIAEHHRKFINWTAYKLDLATMDDGIDNEIDAKIVISIRGNCPGSAINAIECFFSAAEREPIRENVKVQSGTCVHFKLNEEDFNALELDVSFTKMYQALKTYEAAIHFSDTMSGTNKLCR